MESEAGEALAAEKADFGGAELQEVAQMNKRRYRVV